jgi:hypothetical protein
MDPGLLVLGALTVGATAAIKFFKTKEGFELLPNKDYQDDLKQKQAEYNTFTLSSNPLTQAQDVASLSNAEQEKYKATVDAVFKTPEVISTGPNQVQLGAAVNPYPAYVPKDDSDEGLAAFCQKTPITDSVFDNEKFAKHCGVCINGGTLMDGTKFTGVKGLYIRTSEKDTATETSEKNGSSFVNAAPSVGTCNGASSTAGLDSQYTFAVNKNDYLAFANRAACKKNQSLSNTCATCVQDGSYTYTGDNRDFTTNLTFYVSGSGTITMNLGNDSIFFSGRSQVPASTKNASNKVQLQENSPIVITSTLKEGALIQITLQERTKGTGNLYGVLKVPLSTGGHTIINLDKILLQDDETGTKPRKGRLYKSIPISSIESIDSPILVPGVGKSKMLLSGNIPFVSTDFPFEGIDCKGSLLQTKPESVSRFGGDPCYKPAGQGQNTWSDACLQNRILSVGCTESGDLFKNPSSLKSLSLTQMIQRLQNVANSQFTDKVASKQCTGKDLSTPCDPYINWNPEETGSISPQCLSFLYKNGGDGKPMIGPTYSGPINTFYSLDSNGKKFFCQPNTSLDPSSPQTIQMYQRLATNGYKGNLGIKAVQVYMNDAYNRATNIGLNANLPDSRGGRLNSIQSCYGNIAAIPDTPLPSDKLPKARYIRVRFPDARRDPIQISQLAVYDNRNINVAQGKPTRAANKLANDCGPEKAVDGVLQSRWHPGEYHSAGKGNDFWEVDLRQEYPIAKLVYYNRGDCCQFRSNGMLIECLSSSRLITYTAQLSGKRQETFVPFSPQYNI